MLSKSIFLGFLDSRYPFLGFYFRAHPIPPQMFDEEIITLKDWKVALDKFIYPILISTEATPQLYKTCKLFQELYQLQNFDGIPEIIYKKLDLQELNKVDTTKFLFQEFLIKKIDEDFFAKVKLLSIEDQKVVYKYRYTKEKHLVEWLSKDDFSELKDFKSKMDSFVKEFK